MERRIKIFFCYAREDEALRQELVKQLGALRRQGVVDLWYDREINAGAEWESEIKSHLNSAHIILLLISPDFMDSDYCYGIEMKRAMDRHEIGEAYVIPIILRHVHWKSTPIGRLQALPTDGKPVKSSLWHDLDEAFYNVTMGIHETIQHILYRRFEEAYSANDDNLLIVSYDEIRYFYPSFTFTVEQQQHIQFVLQQKTDLELFRTTLREGNLQKIVDTAARVSIKDTMLTSDEQNQLELARRFIQVYSTKDDVTLIAIYNQITSSPYEKYIILTDQEKQRISTAQVHLEEIELQRKTKNPVSEKQLFQVVDAKDELLNQLVNTVLANIAPLPKNIHLQVVRSMQDIQSYINHGLLSTATEECLRVIDIAPQYLDAHRVLCEIYVRQGEIEQAIATYAILVDTYVVNGRIDDAIVSYRRILQLEPYNLTYRMRLINLLSIQGNKEDLLRERVLAAESYLRLGYMDRALTELEQALQESPTSVPTRLNYALALQKLGRTQQAVTEYQRVLQVDPRNITALMRWHIAMIATIGFVRSTSLGVLTRIQWQLRGEGQKYADVVIREYNQCAEMYPNNADVHFSLGQIYHQVGQFDKVIDAYSLAMRDSAVEVLARVSAGQSLLIWGKPEAAIQQFEQALQSVRQPPTSMDPAVWAARPRAEGEEHRAPEVEIAQLLADAYTRIGRLDQRDAILRQIKSARPVQDEVASTLAEISSRQSDISSVLNEYMDLAHHYRANGTGQTNRVLRVLNEMVRLAPQDPRAHSELADIYVNLGLLDEGITELRLLADIYLRRNELEIASTTLQRVGDIYAEMGNNEEALTSLRQAAELNPESMDLLREVVGFCMQMARLLERQNDREADRYQSIGAEYQFTIARHYFETQQVKEAVAALQQLITMDRTNYDAYDMLGQIYQAVGEYEQASRVYKNLARVNSFSPIARERLATLQKLRTK